MMEHIAADEVSVNVHFIPMPMLTLFKDLGYKIENYPALFHSVQKYVIIYTDYK